MKVLVIGGGGREHALVWKISQSPKVRKIYCIPGNAGILNLAECVNLDPTQIKALANFAEQKGIDLTLVGPELPLTLGIVDEFEKRGLKIFGPKKKAAKIEGSKAFAKKLMKKYKIPTGDFQIFTSSKKAIDYVAKIEPPFVVKADGLAAGKGVIPARSKEEAQRAIKLIMLQKAFGSAGEKMVIEEYLEGEEVSFIAFTDGKTVLPFPSSQDHKPIFEGDKGPNTGGMGAYSPVPWINAGLEGEILNQIMSPTVKGMSKEKREYRGILYAGLMIKDNLPQVLEFNARFGDPETQPLLMRMKSDLLPVLEAVIKGRLSEMKIEWDNRACVCVVMATKGYPDSYPKGMEIKGLKEASQMKDVEIFHAGTALKEGKVVANGGRVLGVTALGQGIKEAIALAYQAVEMIHWEGVYYRKDIGTKALRPKN